MKSNKFKHKYEVISKNFTVSTAHLHYNDELEYGKDKIVRDLLDKFYYECLSTGFEYNCQLDLTYYSNALQQTKIVEAKLKFRRNEDTDD